jgi:hypothetical protein
MTSVLNNTIEESSSTPRYKSMFSTYINIAFFAFDINEFLFII